MFKRKQLKGKLKTRGKGSISSGKKIQNGAGKDGRKTPVDISL